MNYYVDNDCNGVGHGYGELTMATMVINVVMGTVVAVISIL